MINKNERLLGEVIFELRWDPLLSSGDIGATAYNGVVTLKGHVGSYAKKMAAEDAAKRVKGVRQVINQISVIIPEPVPDAVLTDAAIRLLEWNNIVPDGSIHINVTDGQVSVSGIVDWEYEHRTIIDCIQHLNGITGIIDEVMIRPKFDTTVVKQNIRKALERYADIEANKIVIENEGNEVVVKGKVHSWLEKRLVEDAVWSSPGVTIMKDELQIA